MLTILFTVIVGLVEVGPGVCSVDYFDESGNLHNFHTQCSLVSDAQTDTL